MTEKSYNVTVRRTRSETLVAKIKANDKNAAAAKVEHELEHRFAEEMPGEWVHDPDWPDNAHVIKVEDVLDWSDYYQMYWKTHGGEGPGPKVQEAIDFLVARPEIMPGELIDMDMRTLKDRGADIAAFVKGSVAQWRSTLKTLQPWLQEIRADARKRAEERRERERKEKYKNTTPLEQIAVKDMTWKQAQDLHELLWDGIAVDHDTQMLIDRCNPRDDLTPLFVMGLNGHTLEGGAMAQAEEHGGTVGMWRDTLGLLKGWLVQLERRRKRLCEDPPVLVTETICDRKTTKQRDLAAWRRQKEAYAMMVQGVSVGPAMNPDVVSDFGEHLRLVLDVFEDEGADYWEGVESGEDMSDHIYLSLAALETWFPKTQDRSQKALLQMMTWVEQGLPHIDLFDACSKQLTEEHDAYYKEFLAAHLRAFGHDTGIMPASWKDPERIGGHDGSSGTGET